MSLTDIFTPKWKNEKPENRIDAIGAIEDRKVLFQLAQKDPNPYVRMAAKAKISNPAFEPDANDLSESVSIDEIEELVSEKLLRTAATCSQSKYIRIAAVKKINDQELLSKIAKSDRDKFVRITAVKRLKDILTLTDIAFYDPSIDVRIAAVEKIDSQQVLVSIINNDLDVEVRKAAVWKLTDKELVASIANNDKDERVRHVALLKIKHPSFKVEKEIPIATPVSTNATFVVAERGKIQKINSSDMENQDTPTETEFEHDNVMVEELEEPSPEELLEEELEAALPTRYIKLERTQRVKRLKGFLNEPIKKRASKEERDKLKASLKEVVIDPSLENYNTFYDVFVSIYESPYTGSKQVKQLWEQLTVTFPELMDAVEKNDGQKEREEIATRAKQEEIKQAAFINQQEENAENITNEKKPIVMSSTSHISNVMSPDNKPTETPSEARQPEPVLQTTVQGEPLRENAQPIPDKEEKPEEVTHVKRNGTHVAKESFSTEYEKISDQKILGDLARSGNTLELKKSAIDKITDVKVLQEIFETTEDDELRYHLLRQKKFLELTNQTRTRNLTPEDKTEQMKEVPEVREPENKDPEKIQSEKTEITEQSVLEEVALNAPDKRVRKATVEKITDQGILSKIALHDKDAEVRYAAIWEITDETLLSEIAKNCSDFQVRKTAIRKIDDNDILIELAKYDLDPKARLIAIKSIRNQEVLREIVFSDDSTEIKEEAIDRIADQKVLAEIAKKTNNEYIRNLAVWGITNQSILAEVSMTAEELYVRKTAVQRISDPMILSKIAKQAEDLYVRKLAVEKVEDQKYLKDIALEASDMYVRKTAVDKINESDVLLEVIKNDPIDYVRNAAVIRLNSLNKG